mgnify:FL=1
MFVVSESTKKDLEKYALAKSENVLVLENQIDFRSLEKIKKKEDYFVYCGRLTESKRVEDCIKALSLVKDSKLYIIGNGDLEYKRKLNRLIFDLGLHGRVIFTGGIPNEKRNELMAKATAILVTSVREGWGLIVTEANANGTVAITYDIEGLRDANKTGFITRYNNPRELAREMNYLLKNKKELEQRSKASLQFAGKHADWNGNVRRLEKWLGR